MTVYKKLMQARLRLLETKIKKEGRNEYAKFSYFELADFMPLALATFNELGLCGVVSFTAEMATLKICDVDKPEEEILVTSPMSTAALKAVHEVQNLGAVQTYLRRYLWVAALELTEHDQLDSSIGAPDSARGSSPAPKTRQRSPQRGAAQTPKTEPAAPQVEPAAPQASLTPIRPSDLHKKLTDSGLTGYGTKTLLAICKVSTIQEIPQKVVEAIVASAKSQGAMQSMIEKYNQGKNSQGVAVLPAPASSEEALGSDAEPASLEELKERAAKAFD